MNQRSAPSLLGGRGESTASVEKKVTQLQEIFNLPSAFLCTGFCWISGVAFCFIF